MRAPNVPCPTPGCTNTKRIESALCRKCWAAGLVINTTCIVEYCSNDAKAQGLCSGHYWRMKHHGDALADIPLGKKSHEHREGWRYPEGVKRPRKRTSKPRRRSGSIKGGGYVSEHRVLVPRDVPINSWANAKRLDEHATRWQLNRGRGLGSSKAATQYVAGTGLTVETVRNAYCSVCGAGSTYKCSWPLKRDRSFLRERSTVHAERVKAAVERFGHCAETRSYKV